jgi:membrane protease YdiL (CAAX protease family)
VPDPAADHLLDVPIFHPALPTPAPLGRLSALAEVVLCSDFPTQLLIVQLMALVGMQPVGPDGRLSIGYVWTLSILDSVALVGLILVLLRMHGESPRALFLGTSPLRTEVMVGALVTPAIFLLAFGSLTVIQQFAPWLRNVPDNPLADLIRTPVDAGLFVIIAIVAGGIREEIQRAFILDRFERHLGGAAVGIIVFSAAFGLGHLLQGWDTAVVTALLGAAWGVVYLWRRSCIASMVSHSTFNVTQILGYMATR